MTGRAGITKSPESSGSDDKLAAFASVTMLNMEKTLALMESLTKRLEVLESSLGNNSQGVVVVPSTSESGASTKTAEKEKTEKKEKDSTDKDKSAKGKDKSKEKKEKRPRREVFVSYKINCVSEIDAINSTFLVDIKIFYTWVDALLIGKKEVTEEDYLSNKKLFDPQLIITNGHDLRDVSKTMKITDSSIGEVKWTVHTVGTVYMTSMDLRLFPFDCQNLQVREVK